MVTLRDIAKQAGVSIATVSYALNNKNSVSKEKREKIVEIAEEMGYVPNSLAKGLLTGKSNIIGLIGTDISLPYNAIFIKHLEHYTRKNNQHFLLGNTSNDQENEREIIQNFISKNVDALLIMPNRNYEIEVYQKIVNYLKKVGIPLICIDNNLPGIQTNYVMPDFEEGEYIATRYLIDNGHKNIVFVGGNPQIPTVRARYNGFIKAMEESKLKYDTSNFIHSGFKFQDGYQVIADFFMAKKTLPTAFMTINDSVALGVYKALKQNGILVPDDVSLVGHDDILLPTMEDIPLTTIRIPLENMSKLIVEVIIRCLEDNDIIQQYLIKPQLIIRNSVKKMS